MPRIKLDALKEGMVVTADVKNLDDMLLIPAGCTLGQKHIEILHSWGVADVEVDSAGQDDESSDPFLRLPPEVADKLAKDLKSLFWRFDADDPVQQEVYSIALRRKARQLAP